jgi:hypothetical protein
MHGNGSLDDKCPVIDGQKKIFVDKTVYFDFDIFLQCIQMRDNKAKWDDIIDWLRKEHQIIVSQNYLYQKYKSYKLRHA